MKIDIEKKWEEAVKKTKIIRSKYGKLETFKKTIVPYVLINKSVINKNTTVVREGKVEVSPVMIHLPKGNFEFYGFDFKKTTDYSDDLIKSFLLIRGIQLPSMKYSNTEIKLDVFDKPVEEVVEEYKNLLSRKEDIETGIILGIPDIWQFSLIIYLSSLVVKSVDNDIKNILDLF
ncbi:MAG: hypothetical protein ACK4WJ_06005 [Endomicrobiia bacterium]